MKQIPPLPEVFDQVIEKLFAAGRTLECGQPRTFIVINNEECSFLMQAAEHYKKQYREKLEYFFEEEERLKRLLKILR